MKKYIGNLFRVTILVCFVLVFVGCFSMWSHAATVSKVSKTYEIAVVFDNSGSMYNDQSWCRAKYAMEIFASMLDYSNGDVLKIFPMWEVTTDGTMPSSGGSYSAIEIRNSADINKISNMYTVRPSNTPFAPVSEAFQALQASAAQEKWLIVLTDGKFNEEGRGQSAAIDLQSRLSQLASSAVKVQYLGIGSAEQLVSDESRFFYSMKSSDTSLKEDLINVCNTIFQRSVLPEKYINQNNIRLDLSMSNVIVFAQGADARINGLKGPDGNNAAIKLDSGQRRYSEISAGGSYTNASIDYSLAGQVITFGECPKGEYTLDCSGAEAIQVFYEPNVDISITMTNSDGQDVDYENEELSPGEYSMNYTLVDAITGDDVINSELMGNGVTFESKIRSSDGTETAFENGGTVELKPDDAAQIIIEGRYLEDYTISTEDDPSLIPTLKVGLPEQQELNITASVEQLNSWYQLGKQSEWKPIRLKLDLGGEPLTDAQLETVELNLTLSEAIDYYIAPVQGESAFDVYIGQRGENEISEPERGRYEMSVSAVFTDEYGRQTSDEDGEVFEVRSYSFIWRWLKWVVAAGILILLILFILTRKAWPKRMYLKTRGQFNSINIGKRMNIASCLNPDVLVCTAEKGSRLYQRKGTRACVKIIAVEPAYDVMTFKIGTGPEYTRLSDEGFVDNMGRPFKPTIIRHNSSVSITRRKRPEIRGKIIMNKK